MPVGMVEPWDQYNALDTAENGVLSVWLDAELGGHSLVTGLSGSGKAIQVSSANTSAVRELRRVVPGRRMGVLHFAIKHVEISPDGYNDYLYFEDNVGAKLFVLSVLPTGVFQLRNVSSTVLATGVIALLPNNIYQCVLTYDLTTPGDHSFSMKVKNVVDSGLTLSGVSIAASTNDIEMIATVARNRTNGNSFTAIFDDMVDVYDETPDLPEMEVYVESVFTETAQIDWTPLSGTDNAAMIDDLPPDLDTTYNSSDTVGHKDLFAVSAYDRVPESIYCLSLGVFSKKEESATRTIRSIFKPDATEYPGSDENQLQTYTWYWNHKQLNPETAAEWLPADHDALEIGYELQV